jgi:uncharacterized protein (UPF0548 family)
MRTGLRPGRAATGDLDVLVRAARGTEPTYAHVGSTLHHAPPGLRERSVDRVAPGELAEARDALRRWATHTGLGGRVVPGSPPTVGETVAVTLPLGPVELVVPNRIVAVVDERTRFGFAYGTLPGHLAAGEELFLAEVVGPERLRLTVRIHARPATLLTRLGGPLVTLAQVRAAHRYLVAWSRAIHQARTDDPHDLG